jgi:acyl-coenzyme A thioesterase PaaI-like protein
MVEQERGLRSDDPANNQLRVDVASMLRELGHEFVARDLSDENLADIRVVVAELLDRVRQTPVRNRRLRSGAAAQFALSIPAEGQRERHQLFSDSIISGGANPMGLGATLWRDGDAAVMEVVLGRAFEGAPGRAHGGVIAALIDETMGLAMGIQGALAFTVKLDITYRAPTPIGEPIQARAWFEQRQGRKLTIKAVVSANEVVVAEAEGLFVTVNPEKFLAGLIEPSSPS